MTEDQRRRLRAEKDRFADEIRTYPAPIAGCDAQFDHLLERRREIERALANGAGVTATTQTPEP